MARKVFFSFHYEGDAWRAGQVRNSDLIPNEDEYGFVDSVDWEEIKRKGDDAIKQWIGDQLNYTSVTVVLIGTETADRPWVRHEIFESWNRGNGIVGLRIHNMKDMDQKTAMQGRNPLDDFKLPDGIVLSSVCKTYDWVLNDGRNHLGEWVEEAFRIKGEQGDKKIIESSNANKTIGSVVARSVPPSGAFVPQSPWCN